MCPGSQKCQLSPGVQCIQLFEGSDYTGIVCTGATSPQVLSAVLGGTIQGYKKLVSKQGLQRVAGLEGSTYE